MNNVTIHHLEVHLEVPGEGDEARLATVIDQRIRKWWRLMEEAKARQRQANENRSLGDQPPQEA